MTEMYFNINDGYLEALVRGFKGGILRQPDYLNLVQCEILEGECWPSFRTICSHAHFFIYSSSDLVMHCVMEDVYHQQTTQSLQCISVSITFSYLLLKIFQ